MTPSGRCLSSSVGGKEKLRVAVVGGGAAGLASALHLAPLVEAGLLAAPVDVYDAASGSKGREIGVGIWSTALDPFRDSDRPSHGLVYSDMTTHGSWVGDVGYRTPRGDWLMKSHLPTSWQECQATQMPALLFLRERDMLTSLQKAIHWEEHRGTIQMFRDGDKTRVHGLMQSSSRPWSTELVLHNEVVSERDYHLIIAADGTMSSIRHAYGGHDAATRILSGSFGLSSPNELPSVSSWDASQHEEAVGLQDRNYTVFRGNAKLARADMGEAGVSFQTWGEGRSMRFATVPMLYPGAMDRREERQVWFITINDDRIAAETDAAKRRSMLLEDFRDWHNPICRTVKATPPEEILMERAIAHRHCMGPILRFNQVVERMTGQRPPNSGEGPCILFVGDAYMTVDPILAQGFTFALEGAYALNHSVKQSCVNFDRDPSLAFDPYILRKELKDRHEARMDRLICLLRATELVQALGQPSGGTISGALNTKLLRPLTRITPNMIKRPMFDRVLRYSLGL